MERPNYLVDPLTFFRTMDKERLKKWKTTYERILNEEFNQKHMPWMIPVWQRGLDMVNSVLNSTGYPPQKQQLTIFDQQ